MERIIALNLALLLLLLNACSTINASLKAGPIDNTQFVNHVLADDRGASLTPISNYPFHRAWRASDEVCAPEQRTLLRSTSLS